MTRLLAVDTSTSWGGVALLEAEGDSVRVVAEAGLAVRDALAARLLPLVEHLASAAGWSPASIDCFAAARGPGSFTGIRVGLGLLDGFRISSTRPCIGVGTLDAVAEACGPCEADRIPLIPAGRGNVYGARFDASSSPPRTLVPAWAGSIERALEGAAPGVLLVAPGLAPELSGRTLGAGVRMVPASSSIAVGVGRIALRRLAGGLDASDAPLPLYVRPTYAEAGSG